MSKMLLVIFMGGSGCDGSCVQFRTATPEKKTVGGNACIDRPLDEVWKLFCSGTSESWEGGCDCRVTTRLAEAATLLNEQHFDDVLFDLDAFDGCSHHLVSRSENSSAFLFSRLEVEGSSWWLPAEIVHKNEWDAQAASLKNCDLSLKEIYRQLMSEACRGSSRSSPEMVLAPGEPFGFAVSA